MIEGIVSLVGVLVGVGVVYGIVKGKLMLLEKKIESAVGKEAFEQFEKRFDSLREEVQEISRKLDELLMGRFRQ